MSDAEKTILTEARSHVLHIGLNRAAKRNAFDLAMLEQLAGALTDLEKNDDLRAGVIYAVGEHFTAGLDLANVVPRFLSGEPLVPEGQVDPWAVFGRRRTKPLVVAARGRCLTLGIELILAADIAIAASDTQFGQIEIRRGIFPFGGGTWRFPARVGWGNAMRWLLTGDTFDAAEAHRIGLVQEVVAPGAEHERATTIAETIARQAPLGVYATLASAWQAEREGNAAAAQGLIPTLTRLTQSEDAQEGFASFIERRDAVFKGR
ncbi:MAG: crotonase/enoyl-CoA hydratase family protein [Deltaproteobacteria bacterium]|nr:crotonase/enoyl-CoA hydratase family protein [Deltaproteobacteria bacterium]